MQPELILLHCIYIEIPQVATRLQIHEVTHKCMASKSSFLVETERQRELQPCRITQEKSLGWDSPPYSDSRTRCQLFADHSELEGSWSWMEELRWVGAVLCLKSTPAATWSQWGEMNSEVITNCILVFLYHGPDAVHAARNVDARQSLGDFFA